MRFTKLNCFIFCLYSLLFSTITLAEEAVTESLKPCPNKPNCVSSLSTDDDHRVKAFSYSIDNQTAKELLLALIKELPRTEIVTQTDNYLHVTFTSLVFRFVDDVEFLWQSEKKLIQVRSASRIGYSDFGVNRKRVEMLRKKFTEKIDKFLKKTA